MQEIPTDLVEACRRGDAASFREVVRLLEAPLLHFIRGWARDLHTAEDIFQETWLRVVRSLPRWQPQARFSTWVFTIARNLCQDDYRRQRHRRAVSLSASLGREAGRTLYLQDLLPAPTPSPDSNARETEDAERLEDALEALRPEQREVLQLRLRWNMPYAEISALTGDPVGTLKYRLHEAVRRLRGILAPNADAEEEEPRREALP